MGNMVYISQGESLNFFFFFLTIGSIYLKSEQFFLFFYQPFHHFRTGPKIKQTLFLRKDDNLEEISANV